MAEGRGESAFKRSNQPWQRGLGGYSVVGAEMRCMTLASAKVLKAWAIRTLHE